MTPDRRSLFRMFRWLLPLSLALQITAIGLLHQYRTRPGNDHFEFGWEMGRIGRSIALDHGFSNPYDGETGPSAWEPPLYPFLIGGVFKIFGIYTQTSAWVLLTINSVLATLTTIPVFFIARRTFGDRVAPWSAYAWALNPYVWYWSVHWIWDTTFTPLVLSLISWTALELANPHASASSGPSDRNNSRRQTSLWVLFGLLYGIGALANPTMLAFLPFCGLWIWRERFKRGMPSFGGVVVSSILFFMVLAPWVVRNYEVFHRFVFLRDDFGLQVRLGNSNGADGMLMAYLQPNMNKLELGKFQRMGELAYAESCKRIAYDWIAADWPRFAVVSLKRFFYFWNGVPRPTDSTSFFDFRTSGFLATSVLAIWGAIEAVRKKRPGAWLFAGLLLTYPTVYYLVYPHARYRHPMEPELVVLIVFLICEATGAKPPSDGHV